MNQIIQNSPIPKEMREIMTVGMEYYMNTGIVTFL
ncbi:MAG: hypothetical protein ACI9DJ_001649 [Algoriphagus sp.]|jgi:hypothetical protein